MGREDLSQALGDEHHSLRAVFRGSDCHGAGERSLNLALNA
jgi:hypothetical protein